MNTVDLLKGKAILARISQTLRFAHCKKCGNEQPYELGRGVPDCESCGRKIKLEKYHPGKRSRPAATAAREVRCPECDEWNVTEYTCAVHGCCVTGLKSHEENKS